MTPVPRPCLMLVTDRRRLSPDARTIEQELAALERFLDEAIDADVDINQLREPAVPAGSLASLARRAAARAAGTRVRVLVNDRADVAAVAGAAGVHLPARGLPASRLRAIDRGWLIGRSVHVGDAIDAIDKTDEPDVDYLIFGTVYPSASKPGEAGTGLAGLGAAARAARVPVLAIGGITPPRAAACAAAGAAGVAAIGVFLPPGRTPEAMGVGPAARALRAALAGAPPEAAGPHLLQ
jgi:thiamine-phosphate diphosphorylase